MKTKVQANCLSTRKFHTHNTNACSLHRNLVASFNKAHNTSLLLPMYNHSRTQTITEEHIALKTKRQQKQKKKRDRGCVYSSANSLTVKASVDGTYYYTHTRTSHAHTHAYMYTYKILVAQWVERWLRDPMDSMTRGSNPIRSTHKNCEPHPRVYIYACIRTLRTLKILQSMSEFGRLRKHENTAHRKKQKNWVAPYYGCSLSQGKAARISHALHWDQKIIKSNKIKYFFSVNCLIN